MLGLAFKNVFKIDKFNLVNKANSLNLVRRNMDLKLVCKRLNEYANLGIACDWDNVGLLVEPSEPLLVKKLFLTNDLTEPVLEEAIKKEINLIVSYHPAIFRPLKKLTQSEWKERSIVKCIEKRIAIYSPHTSWDSINGGINDWILSAFETKKIEPVEPIPSLVHPSGFAKSVKINIPSSLKEILIKNVSLNDNIRYLGARKSDELNDSDDYEIEFVTSSKGVGALMELIRSLKESDLDIFKSLRIANLEKPLMKNAGLGRLGYLSKPLKLKDVVEKVKCHFQMKTIRIALANGKTLDNEIKTIAVGAGSGSKLLNNTNADLIITGEFSHHEILHETHRGVSVIVTDHSNNERGYREFFKQQFSQLLVKYNENVEIIISEVDKDPLEYL